MSHTESLAFKYCQSRLWVSALTVLYQRNTAQIKRGRVDALGKKSASKKLQVLFTNRVCFRALRGYFHRNVSRPICGSHSHLSACQIIKW